MRVLAPRDRVGTPIAASGPPESQHAGNHHEREQVPNPYRRAHARRRAARGPLVRTISRAVFSARDADARRSRTAVRVRRRERRRVARPDRGGRPVRPPERRSRAASRRRSARRATSARVLSPRSPTSTRTAAPTWCVLGSRAASTSSLVRHRGGDAGRPAPPPHGGLRQLALSRPATSTATALRTIVFGRRSRRRFRSGTFRRRRIVLAQRRHRHAFTERGIARASGRSAPAAMKFVDFDLDGDQDLAMTKPPNGIAIATNIGGTFTVPAGYLSAAPAVAGSPCSSAARLNGDADSRLRPWRARDRAGAASTAVPRGPTGVDRLHDLRRRSEHSHARRGLRPHRRRHRRGPDLGDPGDRRLLDRSRPGRRRSCTKLDRRAATLLAADFDGDADVDLLLLAQARLHRVLLRRRGRPPPARAGLDPRFLLGGPIALDLSGDGAPELVGTRPTSAWSSSRSRRTTAPGGSRGRRRRSPEPRFPNVASFLAAADVDGDGLKDLVLVEGTRLRLQSLDDVERLGPGRHERRRRALDRRTGDRIGAGLALRRPRSRT